MPEGAFDVPWKGGAQKRINWHESHQLQKSEIKGEL
jgi:hypothetical protein